jgi:tetratricopeptide (TPR) repeat protein
MVAADPANRMALGDLGTVLMRIGLVTETPEEREESLAALRKSAQIIENLGKTSPLTRSLESTLVQIQECTGTRLMEAGGYEAAAANFQKALAIAERHATDNPEYAAPRYQIMEAYKGLAITRAKQGDRSGASAQLQQAMQVAERMENKKWRNPFPARIRTWTALSYAILAQAPNAPGEQSLADCKQALDTYARSQELWAAGGDTLRTRYRYEIEQTAGQVRFCEQRFGLPGPSRH